MADTSAAKPAPAFLTRWREKILDTFVLAIPLAIVGKLSGWLQLTFFDTPWQILWIALPLALAAWISWRVLRRPGAKRAHWGFYVFLGAFCSIFAIASTTDLLVWKRTPTGPYAGAATDRYWLVPLKLGDWRYKLITPAKSDKGHFVVVVLEHPDKASREKLRQNDRRVIEVAKRGNALGVAFDIAYEGSSGIDNLFCASLDGFSGTVILPFAYRQVRENGDFVPAKEAPPATLPCLAKRDSGHAMGLAEADDLVRSIPVLWDGDENAPALSLLVARNIGGNDLRLPEDHLLRYVPADPGAIKIYKDIDLLTKEPLLVEHKFVFIGETSTADTFKTPLGLLPGAEIHALAANSLLAGQFITRPSGGISAFVVFASCYILVLFGSQGYSTRTLAFVAACITVMVFALAAAAIHFLLVWLDVAYAVAATWALLPLLVAFRRFAPFATR